MNILLVGANSFVGSGAARALIAAGHRLHGLARSPEASDVLAGRGIHPLPGEVMEIGAASRALRDHDACIWTSFLPLKTEQEAVARLLSAIEGSGKTFIFTSGTAVLGTPARDGEWSERSLAEDDPFVPPSWLAIRRDTESLVFAAAGRGVRSMVVRPPMVWGHGGSRQIPWIFGTAREAGQACYIGRGLNIYSHVHVDDLADLYVRALERGSSGAVYHAVAGEENFRSIAEAVGDVMNVAASSVDVEAMAALLGEAVTQTAFALNSRSRCPRSRSELGWTASRCDLIADIRHGSYRSRFGTARR